MSELSGFSAQQVIAIFKKFGWLWKRTKGSHAILEKNSKICVVPLHRVIAVGTLRDILRKAGISPKDFLNKA